MKLQEVIAKHTALFPEEWYLTRGNALLPTTEDADPFAQRYMEHLSYYETHLAPLFTERTAKQALNIAYHLANDEALTEQERFVALTLLEEEPSQPPCVARYLAQTDLRASLLAHDARFLPHKGSLPARKIREAPASFDNPIHDWENWCQYMYGFTPLTLHGLESAAHETRTTLANMPESSIPPLPGDIAPIAQQLSDILGRALDMHVTNASIVPLPNYLESMIPSAAAYSFARFENPRRVTFLNMQAPWTLPSLTLLMAHETYAHLWHFAEVDAHATLSRRLPAMYRYTCTEGVALLVEDHVATRAVEALSQELSISFSIDATTIKHALVRTMLSMRLRRILRSMFEHYVYALKMEPAAAIARVLPLSFDSNDDLSEDLYAYLPTPGYASTYFNGFSILKKMGASLDDAWRKRIADSGFDIQSLAS